MALALLELYLLLIPGFAVTTLLGIRRQQLLFSVTFSFAMLIVLVSLARNYYWSVEWLMASFIIVPLALVALIALFYRDGFAIQRDALSHLLGDRPVLYGLLVVIGGYTLWYLITGPYTEVPADLYRHLEFMGFQYEILESGSAGPPLSLTQLATQQGAFWYVMLSLCVLVTGASFAETLYPVMFVGGLLLLSATYLFSLVLFRPLSLSAPLRVLAAVLGCGFVVAQMGVNAFSFFRYYSYAPAMLNAIVVMAAMTCLLEIPALRQITARSDRPLVSVLNLLILFLVCAAIALVMHRQEAVFIGAWAGALVLWLLFDWLARRISPDGWRGYLIATICLLIAGLCGFFVLTLIFPHAVIPPEGSGKIVALPLAWPGFGPLHILNPKFQFAEVVTVWGGIVILGFLLLFRLFRVQPLLIAGMLVPLLTVFNPLFVDLFLRLEDEHSLWRLCFLMPLYTVAGLLPVMGWSNRHDATSLQKAAWGVMTVALLTLPFMVQANRYVRTTNLPVAAANSYQLWNDLLDFLGDMPKPERVLTDPVTGYVVSGLTQHHTFRYKFLASEQYQAFRFAFDNYDNKPLSRYRDWLLVVNQRDGAPSQTGRRTRHWPEDIMVVSQYYPDALLDHLEANPVQFELLWSANRISVYRIR